MSANLVVDLHGTCDYRPSITVGSGSNFTVGQVVDLLGADTYTQVFAAANIGGSGPIELRIQTADVTTSGSFTDPTSGLAAFPVRVVSGGLFWANSGLYASGWSSPCAVVDSAPIFCSGGVQFGALQRPHRYARMVLNSGSFPGGICAGFLGNKRTIGSGGGFTFAPTSGVVSV